jgi:histone acetyltransferase HTATIP/histone acetyltransferase MYST1
MDEWVPEKFTEIIEGETVQETLPGYRPRKRKRTPQHANGDCEPADDWLDATDGNSSEEEGIAEHQMLTARRNFDLVNFGEYQMKTWYDTICCGSQGALLMPVLRYFSPYPITESESEELSQAISKETSANSRADTDNSHSPAAKNGSTTTRKTTGKGLHRTTLRSHGRTADMLAGGLNRDIALKNGEPNVLWVCNKCFKYMNEGLPYEIHTVRPALLTSQNIWSNKGLAYRNLVQ